MPGERLAGEQEPGDEPEEIVSPLIDLSAVSLADLDQLESPVLASALARIRHEIEHPEEAVAGFQNSC